MTVDGSWPISALLIYRQINAIGTFVMTSDRCRPDLLNYALLPIEAKSHTGVVVLSHLAIVTCILLTRQDLYLNRWIACCFDLEHPVPT